MLKTLKSMSVLILMLCFAGISQAELVLHWKLDEAAGPTAVDDTGGNDGTENGTVTWGVPGVDGTGVSLGAGANSIRAAHDVAFESSTFTASVWFTPEAGSPWGAILSDTSEGAGQYSGLRYYYNLAGDGILDCWMSDDGAGTWVGTSWDTDMARGISAPADGSTYHLVGTYDGTDYSVYLDGVLQWSVTTAYNPDIYGGDFSIGQRSDGGAGSINMDVDDVQFYTNALSSTQVEFLFNNPGVAISSDPPSINVFWETIAEWDFNDAPGSTALNDISGNGNVGSVVDGTVVFDGSTGYFDGSSEIRISNSLGKLELNQRTPFRITIDLIETPANSGIWRGIIGNRVVDEYGLLLYHGIAGANSFGFWTGSSDNPNFWNHAQTSPNAYSSGENVTVVMKYDGIDTQTITINGVTTTSSDFTSYRPAPINSEWTIGDRGSMGQGSDDNRFIGKIDNIHIEKPASLTVITHTCGETKTYEDGPVSDSFTVNLLAIPENDVTITIVNPVNVSEPNDLILNELEAGQDLVLNFTPANWDIPQIVAVTANDDCYEGIVEDSIEILSLSMELSSSDPNFNAGYSESVQISIVDSVDCIPFAITLYDQYVIQPEVTMQIDLVVSDYGRAVSYLWSQTGGPGAVTFETGTDVEDPTVTLPNTPGAYTFSVQATSGIEVKYANLRLILFTPDRVPGDVNRDRSVDIVDLAQMAAAWLVQADAMPEDLNNDDKINLGDYGLLAANWLKKGGAIILKNDHVIRQLLLENNRWRTALLSRADGSDAMKVVSDEFHILLLDGSEVTINDYEVTGQPDIQSNASGTTVTINYSPQAGISLPTDAPNAVTIVYSIGDDPWVHKQVTLDMDSNDKIDRLEVERFVVSSPVERGGRGEPVFIDDNWFWGLTYPAAYTRHTNGNMPVAHSGHYDTYGNYSFIDLEGHDIESSPRDGLVRMMHFPGPAREIESGRWGIVSKKSVVGLGDKDDPMELQFFDYLNAIRKPVRSFVHYNNWYDGQGKNLTISNFVDNTYMTFKNNLDPYGVTIDAMVPDNYWQNSSSVFEPGTGYFPNGMDDWEALSNALQAEGTNLGMWMALNGTASINTDWAVSNGYSQASLNPHFARYYACLSLAYPPYLNDLRSQLGDLITRGDIAYIKHDFNSMCDVGPNNDTLPTDRHGHERAVDVELDLLAYERTLNSDIYQNVTNWIWFSPWWLEHGNNLWMLAGDTGVNRNWPNLSYRKMAITYRDDFLHQMWGTQELRPLVPISHLMTHGIIYATNATVEEVGDGVREWSDYVMMYYCRGLQLKEWYITPSWMNSERWRVLGQDTRWSEENVNTLANSVYVGGEPDAGEAYGYACWNGTSGILTVRNPSPNEVNLEIPFDKSVWYRDAVGVNYRANVVYPYQGEWPQTLTAGQPMTITIPGYYTMVMELEPGVSSGIDPAASLNPVVMNGQLTGVQYDGQVTLPNESMKRSDLIVIAYQGTEQVSVNGNPISSYRSNSGNGWTIRAYDLSAYQSQTIDLTISDAGGLANYEAWLLLDRPVTSPAEDTDVRLPYAIDHGFRRQTYLLTVNQ